MLKVVNFLKYMWLLIAVVTFLIATYHIIFTAVNDGLFFYAFSAMATILYFVRKKQQKRLEKISK